jgi:hypothetical protein
MPELDEALLVSRSPDMVMDETGGEITLMRLDLVRFFKLNETASEIWRLVETQRTVADLIAELVIRYDVQRSVVAADLCSALRQMEEAGAIRTR